MERRQEVRIFDEMLPLRAEVATLGELSGHADQREIIDWIKPIAGKLKRVFLVHGEPDGQAGLADELEIQLALKVVCPARGDSFELGEI
jgi:metallo-beta-lactamase family protein